MSNAGGSLDLMRIREGLLDALEALEDHRDAVVVVGAQAIYLHVGPDELAGAAMTKDSDLSIDPRVLEDDPLIDHLMESAGFVLMAQSNSGKVGNWQKSWMQETTGVDVDIAVVDLMVPDKLAKGSSRRDSKVRPHATNSMRRAPGLEAAASDFVEMDVTSLPGGSGRSARARVATPSALLVAKMIKLEDRAHDAARGRVDRLQPKDALDVYRILVAIEAPELADGIQRLRCDELAADITNRAMNYLNTSFAAGPDAAGCRLVVEALGPSVPDAGQYAESTYFLALDLAVELQSRDG